jgi:WD40 repeat protein
MLVKRAGERMMVSTSPRDWSVCLWDSTSGQPEHTFYGHRWLLYSLAVSRDGSFAATCGSDGLICVWDLRKKQRRHQFQGHEYQVMAAVYAPDGKTLVTRGGDDTVRIWDTKLFKEIAVWPGGETRPHSVTDISKGENVGNTVAQSLTISSDGKLLAGSQTDGTVCVWGFPDGRKLLKLSAHNGKEVGSVFSPDGKTIASGDSKGTVVLWDLRTRSPRWERSVGTEAEAVGKGIQSLAFSPDGRNLAVSRCGGRLSIMETATGQEIRSLSGEADSLLFSKDGTYVIVASRSRSGETATIRFVDVLSGNEFRKVTFPVNTQDRQALALSPDGLTLATTGGEDGLVYWFESATLREICRFQGHARNARCVVFSPDGRSLATGGRDTTVLIWDLLGALCRGAKDIAWDEDQRRRIWSDLGDTDPKCAFVSMAALAAHPKQAVELVRDRVQVNKWPKRKSFAQIIKELDDEAFDTRDAALRELIARGPAAAVVIAQALEKPSPAEVKSKLKGALQSIRDQGFSRDELRTQRAVQFLQMIGSREALQLLEEYSAGDPETALTDLSRHALGRAGQRSDRP